MTDRQPIQAAVFDLGGVLIRYDTRRIVEAWADTLGCSSDEIPGDCHDSEMHHMLERGEITFDEFHRYACESIGHELSMNDFFRAWNDIYLGLMPGMESLLERLSLALRIFAFTNTNSAHTAVWRPLYRDALRHFERIFISHDMGVRKPEERSFLIVLEALGLPADAVVFIDDREENVEAARALGIHGIVFENAQDTETRFLKLGVRLDAPATGSGVSSSLPA